MRYLIFVLLPVSYVWAVPYFRNDGISTVVTRRSDTSLDFNDQGQYSILQKRGTLGRSSPGLEQGPTGGAGGAGPLAPDRAARRTLRPPPGFEHVAPSAGAATAAGQAARGSSQSPPGFEQVRPSLSGGSPSSQGGHSRPLSPKPIQPISQINFPKLGSELGEAQSHSTTPRTQSGTLSPEPLSPTAPFKNLKLGSELGEADSLPTSPQRPPSTPPKSQPQATPNSPPPRLPRMPQGGSSGNLNPEAASFTPSRPSQDVRQEKHTGSPDSSSSRPRLGQGAPLFFQHPPMGIPRPAQPNLVGGSPPQNSLHPTLGVSPPSQHHPSAVLYPPPFQPPPFGQFPPGHAFHPSQYARPGVPLLHLPPHGIPPQMPHHPAGGMLPLHPPPLESHQQFPPLPGIAFHGLTNRQRGTQMPMPMPLARQPVSMRRPRQASLSSPMVVPAPRPGFSGRPQSSLQRQSSRVQTFPSRDDHSSPQRSGPLVSPTSRPAAPRPGGQQEVAGSASSASGSARGRSGRSPTRSPRQSSRSPIRPPRQADRSRTRSPAPRAGGAGHQS